MERTFNQESVYPPSELLASAAKGAACCKDQIVPLVMGLFGEQLGPGLT